MIRDPKDLQRYTPQERANHWVVGISFILLALSGLAFFHPAFYPLANLLGGGTWARILHPYIGVFMAFFFVLMFLRFHRLNVMTKTDKEWLDRIGEMVDGNDQNMPEQGKYNGGQKMMFWLTVLCIVLLAVSGLLMWRAQFTAPINLVRFASVVHAVAATAMIVLIVVHVYAAIWVRGTLRAMWYGTVTRAWARQHHRAWYREMTGK
ncbi:MAG: formate dehydrogenase subunit gamma [Betaproteobacteria bacterium]|nr:formate dehydrogenase subunit gamma [Betaproteobacteria bacterium]